MVESVHRQHLIPNSLVSSKAQQKTNLCITVACHNHCKRHQIQDSEDDLCKRDIGASIGDAIEQFIDVDVSCGIHQWSGAAIDFGVIAFAGEVLRYLLHVGRPIDLGIYFSSSV